MIAAYYQPDSDFLFTYPLSCWIYLHNLLLINISIKLIIHEYIMSCFPYSYIPSILTKAIWNSILSITEIKNSPWKISMIYSWITIFSNLKLTLFFILLKIVTYTTKGLNLDWLCYIFWLFVYVLKNVNFNCMCFSIKIIFNIFDISKDKISIPGNDEQRLRMKHHILILNYFIVKK